MNNEIENEKEWAQNFKRKLIEREKEKIEQKVRTKQNIIVSLEKFLESEYEILAIYESGKIRFANSLDELPHDHDEHADDDRVIASWTSKQKLLEKLNGAKDKYEVFEKIADEWSASVWGNPEYWYSKFQSSWGNRFSEGP